MSNAAYFVQECPTCGRSLQIRVEYLGKKVTCMHCHGRLEARDPTHRDAFCSDSGVALLRRAEELLQQSTETGSCSRVGNPR